MRETLRRNAPTAVIGGGVIGLSIAWQLARRGEAVTVFERGSAGRGASWVAAGMLAPHSEVGFEGEDFLRLAQESLKLYPRFLDELEENSGDEITLDENGTLMIGLNRDDRERLRRLYDFREHLALPVKWLSGTEAREMEPLLSPKTASAIWLPDDRQIDNRKLVEALKTAFQGVGGELLEGVPVHSVRIRGGRVSGIETDRGKHEAKRVVVAAGCWSGQIGGIPENVLPPVRPVKGQIISLRKDSSYGLSRVVRAPDAYLVPKEDGRLLLGASEEEMGFDTRPTAGPMMKLLDRGYEAVPSVFDLPLEGIEVGLRPGSRDHDPIIGETALAGLYYATGHYRHGILFAPITAYEMSSLILEKRSSDFLEPFKPSRFYPKTHKIRKKAMQGNGTPK